MRKLNNILKGCGLAFFASLFLFSCVNDDDFDVPVFTGEVEEVFGGGGETPVFQSCFKEDFESYDDGTDSFPAYENVSSLGARLWAVDEFGGNKYLRMSAFSAGSYTFSYFAFPVDFDTADILRFKTQDRFNNGTVLKVFYTTEYSVTDNIVEANLTEITGSFTIATGTTSGTTLPFVNSGNYDLSGISGNGYIVFKYEGDGLGATTNMHIDDIELFDTDLTDCTPQDPCGTEDFSGLTDGAQTITGYQNIGADGKWEIDQFSGNNYLKFSAFDFAPGTAQDTWFIMGVNFDNAEEMNFMSQEAFDTGGVLTVHTSTNYDEMGDPSTATWTDITSNFTIASGNTGGFGSFINSGSYAFGLTGMGYVAFRYEGEKDLIETRMHIDNIQFTNFGGASPCTFDVMPVPVPPTQIIISEIADPNNSFAAGIGNARFIELYNAGTASVNLNGWKLTRWTNANTTPSTSNDIDLTTTLAPGATWVIAAEPADFMTTYGMAADQDGGTSGAAASNGDDNIALLDATGAIVDMFGVAGEDGSGTGHEFEDGRANRKASITMPNATWTQSEWDIWNDTGAAGTTNNPQDAPADFTPGVR